MYIEDGTNYDIVFADSSRTDVVLSKYTSALIRVTTNYIKPDKYTLDGMLVRIRVNSGKALLRITSTGRGLTEDPLTPYIENDSPLEYKHLTVGQTAEYLLPRRSDLSAVSLAMFGTEGTRTKRVINSQTGSYEIYDFTETELRIRSYEYGAKTKSLSCPYTSDSTITITVAPPNGQHFVRWECNIDISFDKNASETQVTIPNILGYSIFFAAIFESEEYLISLSECAGGSVVPDKAEAKIGETVTVIPDPGYTLSSVSLQSMSQVNRASSASSVSFTAALPWSDYKIFLWDKNQQPLIKPVYVE